MPALITNYLFGVCVTNISYTKFKPKESKNVKANCREKKIKKKLFIAE